MFIIEIVLGLITLATGLLILHAVGWLFDKVSGGCFDGMPKFFLGTMIMCVISSLVEIAYIIGKAFIEHA